MSINKMIAASIGALLLLATPMWASAAPESGLSYTATVAGQNVADASEAHPLVLDPKHQTTVEITVTNTGRAPVTVESIGLNGKILGLTLFNVRTAVSLAVPPGKTDKLAFKMDISDLDGQATGLVAGSFSVRTSAGQELVNPVVSKVEGSLFSVYGLFGLGLVIITILAAVDTGLAIARGRLPENRFRRGLMTMAPGIGIGFVLIFSLSALSIWVPTGPRWIISALLFAGACFAAGYFTGAPDDSDELDDQPVEVEANFEGRHGIGTEAGT
ncbi:hypothetical protein [Smaragdicoccus niigatensis]|uniref:hypothetical protein n=1 Tax=Smaragdicoccus niigatensis TaxID=359359 RepID=UPI0003604A04|nr:hypothetical protein [Smaragdicoccus niigatensis]